MDDSITNASLDEEIHYCALHPERDTGLRCNRCDRYMCIECAKRTPVGYTCRECVRGHENRFYQGTLLDYAIVAAVSAAGGALTVYCSHADRRFSHHRLHPGAGDRRHHSPNRPATDRSAARPAERFRQRRRFARGWHRRRLCASRRSGTLHPALPGAGLFGRFRALQNVNLAPTDLPCWKNCAYKTSLLSTSWS